MYCGDAIRPSLGSPNRLRTCQEMKLARHAFTKPRHPISSSGPTRCAIYFIGITVVSSHDHYSISERCLDIQFLYEPLFSKLFSHPFNCPHSLNSFSPVFKMKSFASFLVISFLACAHASVLSTTNIATVLAGAASQSSLTIPAAAMTAISKLDTVGATASALSAADTTAISDCAQAARDNNTASKADLGGAGGSAGNIAL
jgi:hypothetical protein